MVFLPKPERPLWFQLLPNYYFRQEQLLKLTMYHPR
jgi:hypothetical protein